MDETDTERCIGRDELGRLVWHAVANGGSCVEFDKESHRRQIRSRTSIAKNCGGKNSGGFAKKIQRVVC